MSLQRILVSYDGEWVESPEGGVFRFNGSKAKGMSVPKNITYQELLDRVYRLLMVEPNEFAISMKFLYASRVPVPPVEIVSDDDVSFFIGENSSKISLRTPLCVSVVRRSSHVQQTAYGEGSSQTFNVMPETQEQTYGPIALLSGIEENETAFCVNNEHEDNNICADNNAPVDPVTPVAPAAPPVALAAPVAPAAPAAPAAAPPVASRAATPVARTYNTRASQKQNEWVTTKEGLTVSRKEVVTANKKEDRTPFTKEDLTVSSAKHSDELESKQIFPSKRELQEKLSMLAIKKKFEFKVKRSTKKVLVIACIDDSCEWQLRAVKMHDSASFQIRKFVKNHSCSTEAHYDEHRQASSWFIGQYIKSKSQETNRTYKPKEIIEDIRKEFGVNLSYEKAWRAREIAMNSDNENEPRRRRLSGWSSGTPRKQMKSSDPDERPGRKCGRCGEPGHYRQTCPTAYPQFLTNSSVDNQDEVPSN